MEKLNSKRQSTYDAIYTEPKSSDIYGDDVMKLLIHLPASSGSRDGSRVTFLYGSQRMKMHLPHKKGGKKPLLKYQIEDIRKFLSDIRQNIYGDSDSG